MIPYTIDMNAHKSCIFINLAFSHNTQNWLGLLIFVHTDASTSCKGQSSAARDCRRCSYLYTHCATTAHTSSIAYHNHQKVSSRIVLNAVPVSRNPFRQYSIRRIFGAKGPIRRPRLSGMRMASWCLAYSASTCRMTEYMHPRRGKQAKRVRHENCTQSHSLRVRIGVGDLITCGIFIPA